MTDEGGRQAGDIDPYNSSDPAFGDATFSVTDLCATVKVALELSLPGELWVRGEIQSLRRTKAGHVYFDLVDAGTLGRAAAARIPVALFANNKFSVNATLRRAGGGVRMNDGVEIRIRGKLDFHPPTGQLKLVMSTIDPEFTLGRLAADKDRLLRALAAEGLLDRQRGLARSRAPLRVALVTSANSAAEHDFLAELEASGFAFQVFSIDARVQGDGAVEAIVKALRHADRLDVDTIALVRGGGARTDLATFDHEDIARTIAALRTPVWTGIGHEIDTAIADSVANIAFKTPTACAAGVVDATRAFVDDTERSWAAVLARATTLLDAAELRTESAANRLVRTSSDLIGHADERLMTSGRRLAREAAIALRTATQGLDARARMVDALDPARVLARGWSITRDESGNLVRDPAHVAPGDELRTTVAGGEVRSSVSPRD